MTIEEKALTFTCRNCGKLLTKAKHLADRLCDRCHAGAQAEQAAADRATGIRRKCFLCHRPAAQEMPQPSYCKVHLAKYKAEMERKKREALARQWWKDANYFVTWRGMAIAVFVLDEGERERFRRLPDSIKPPKRKTIDLDIFHPELTRDEVKRFKRFILQCHQLPPVKIYKAQEN